MKIEELKAMTIEELNKKIDDSKKELFNLRFRLATKQLVNHREIPKVKKNIAQLMTVKRQKELSSITSAPGEG